MRVLWVTEEVPDQDGGGGGIRQYHLLRRLSAEATVDLLMIGELPAGSALRETLHAITSRPRPAPAFSGPLPQLRRRLHNLATFVPGRPPSGVVVDAAVASAVRRDLRRMSGYDLVQVEHEVLAGVTRGVAPARRTALTLHNLMSRRSLHQAEVAASTRLRRLWQADARRATAWERRAVDGYDVTIVMSDADAAAVGPGAAVVPNGVDLERFTPAPLPADPILLFSGSFNYEPNIDAARWLVEEVLPLVRSEIPAASLLLVGRTPDARVRHLASRPGVEAHFDVPSVVPFLHRARVAVVALRQGSGTRLKALEAMAAGRPLAGTTLGLEGLGLLDGRSALIADGPEALAGAAVRLCRDDGLAAGLAGAARRVAEERYSWERVADLYLATVVR